MGPSLARRIERALNQLEQGSSLTEAMWAGLSRGSSTRHPSDGPQPVDWKARAELESALRAVQRLRAGPHPQPRAEFRAAARERIVAAARASGRPVGSAPKPRRSLIRRFLPFAAALTLVGSGVITSFVANPTGTAFADVLAPALYAVEQVQLAAVPDDDSRARLSLTIAERRRADLESAAAAGHFDRAASIAARYTASLATASQAGATGSHDAEFAANVADESERGAAAISRIAESAPSPIASRLRSISAASPTPVVSAPILVSTSVAATQPIVASTFAPAARPIVASATPTASATSTVAAAPNVEFARRGATDESRRGATDEYWPADPRLEVANRAAELAVIAFSEVGKPAATPTLPTARATIELASRSQSSVQSQSPEQAVERAERRDDLPATATVAASSQPGRLPAATVPKVVVPAVSVPKVTVPTVVVPTPRVVRPPATSTPRAQPSPTPTVSASKTVTGNSRTWWSIFGN
jgi:hypothetical protein